ncbi:MULTISPECIES: VOC family protein [unclassified Mesorhizobium]|uniref:VOC family protein n=1 Tax=unclassified Mesorhizobium TaxID=325217 RepID=UPI003014A0DF
MLLGVDHFVVLVPDLETARKACLDAGFTATPIAHHSAASGTANTCIVLPQVYIELMGIVAETPASNAWGRLLRSGPGLKGVALGTSDIEQTAAQLSERGLAADPVRRFSRHVPEGELGFSVIRLSPDLTPGLQCLYCQHHTPELLWSPDALQHENGARRVTAAMVPQGTALEPFAGGNWPALPVSDGPTGRITIAFDRPVPGDALAAIHHVTGVLIEEAQAS